MTARRAYTRHGLTAPMVRVKLAGFSAIDRRTAAAREAMGLKRDLIAAQGGEADLSPQRRRLTDMVVRASLLLDHVDAWIRVVLLRPTADPLVKPGSHDGGNVEVVGRSLAPATARR